MKPAAQAGFTAVELLITLFIAAAFLAVGYQLYGVIIKDSGEARDRARASNISYQQLRKIAATTNPCIGRTMTQDVPDETLPNVSMVTVVNCSHAGLRSLSKVTVTVSYGSPRKEIVHALLVSN